MKGRLLPDAPIGTFPIESDDLLLGDCWFVTVREDHPEAPRRLNVRDHAEDRRWWGQPNDPRYSGNLTGLVLGLLTPLGQFSMLSIHTVREHDDGTVSVRPGDGSSNSIKVEGPKGTIWHGYVEHNVWRQV